MNYCQFRNDFIKRMAVTGSAPILPAEYQQVEYLQSTGTQYIDTGVLPGSYSISLSASVNNVSAEDYVFGQWASSDRYNLAFSSGNASIGYKTTFYSGDSVTNDVFYKYNVTLASGVQELYINDVRKAGGSLAQSISSSYTIILFGGRYIGTGGVNYHHYGKIRYFTISDYVTGNKIIDLIPCYRKSDNKPGMYDLVTNTFFTNAGTGEFTVGNDVL